MQENNISLSIVIPFYDDQEYLSRCIDTLLMTEGIDETQIILIDDGSGDGSGQLADDYSRKYTNISVIHQENKGPSEARNAGIRASTGKYIFFCDSDDEVVPSLFSKVIERSRSLDTDILLWDAELFDDHGSQFSRKQQVYFVHKGLHEEDSLISGKEALEKQLDDRMNYPATVWLGLHKRQFIIDNELFFEKGLLHEDELWVTQAMLQARSVEYMSQKIYRYRIRKGSITNPDHIDWTHNIESLLYLYPELYKKCDVLLGNGSLNKKLKGTLTRRYLHMIFEYDFVRYGYGDRIDKDQLWNTSLRLVDKVRVIILVLYSAIRKTFKGG